VICFSPRHDLTLAKMSVAEMRAVVDVWTQQERELGADEDVHYVQIFENRGAMMGASNSHPHGQVWASRSVSNEVVAEQAGQTEYLAEHGCCLLCAYRELEMGLGERVVTANESFVAVVPYWAVWPFEVMVLPLRHVADLDGMTDAERDGLAAMLQMVTATYDKVCSILRFRIRWGCIRSPAMGRSIRSGTFMRAFIRRCCGRRRYGSLWLDLNCWEDRSGILLRSLRRRCCDKIK
jgi:galactose-1-phosphate uridylyltransferase (family 1)